MSRSWSIALAVDFADRELVGSCRVTVPPRRTLHLLFSDLEDREPVPRDTDLPSVILPTVAGTVNGYPPIGDYAAIGDGRTVALVSREGSVDWLCLPHFGSSALFAALVDRARGGHFALRPRAPFRATRRYLGDTNVLETRFETGAGSVLVTDCLVLPRTRDELRPRAELLRIVRGLEGAVEMTIEYEPRGDFGRAHGRLEHRGPLGWAYLFKGEAAFLQGDTDFERRGEEGLAAQPCVAAGQQLTVSLAYTRRDIAVVPPLGETAAQRVEDTRKRWQRWADGCNADGEYRDAIVRSALVLKLLHFELSGAVVAASTTSLPEVVGGVRNWDYRYCWLRDAALTFRAFLDLGYTHEAAFFLDWLLHTTRVSWPRLHVLYDVFGNPGPKEQDLTHFAGYRGSRPVRTGNAAHNQLQLDVYGAVIQAAHEFVEHGGTLDLAKARCIAGFGRTVCRLWREPDEGIWERRSGRAHHTHSKIMCWLALDRLLDLAERGHVNVPTERFRRERDAIEEAIEQSGFNPRLGAYTAIFDGDTPDASLLLAARCGYRPANHPRMQGTYALIERTLANGALLYRYPPGTDGLPGTEGAFGIAGFWAVEYLALAGRIDEGRARFEKLLAYANDVGLYAEETSPTSGEPLGNFPQAFTHVGLITAANALRAATRRNETRSAGAPK
jgi:GH15 family glucan-1,4-alpha-glucosidase